MSENNTYNNGQDALKAFQLDQVPISDKESKDFGLRMSRKIWGQVQASLGGYYYARNARFIKNRNFANGLIDVQSMFRDRFQFNGKQNYIRLAWQTLQIVNRIVSGLIGRWMEREEKINVTAIDDLSQNDKKEEYDQLEFIVANRKMVESLQQASGVNLMPQDKDIPEDKDELDLWQSQFQRTPEEIMQEMGCNNVLQSNGWFDVLKEKMLHDSSEVGLVGTNTWMDKQGVIHVEWVKPENAVYSATDYEDFRDTTYRGEIPSLKISELRKCWGKEFNPDNPLALTEEELFKIAQTAKEYKTVTNLLWNDIFNTLFFRPYDEWNVRCLKFEVKSVDEEPYTVTTSKSTSTTYTEKGLPRTASGKLREKPLDNQNVLTDTNINIYKGAYLPDTDTLMEWGLKTNMIRPQDPTEAGNAEFSYSFYMYQNYQMRNMAIPEKIEAAIDGMMHACLKMQQVIARMRPTGAAINTDALQEIDFGLGDDDSNKGVNPKKLYDQTGDIYYRGRDAEGNPIPVPIVELQNSGFIGQMDGLIKNYQFWYERMKDDLGEDPNLITAALQPRVTNDNVEAAQDTANFATDYMYKAYTECMKQTSKKISCLLKDSITYGSKAYRDSVGEEVTNRVFTTEVKLMPTAQMVAVFTAMMNQAMQSTPQLVLFIDPMRLIRIAKQDVKLAEIYFRRGQKKMLQFQQQQAAQNSQMNAEAQQQSLQQKAALDKEHMQVEMEMKAELSEKESKNKKEEIILNGVFQVMAKGVDVQPEWKPVIDELIHNVAIPLLSQNIQSTTQLGAAIQQAQPQNNDDFSRGNTDNQQLNQSQPQAPDQQQAA